MTATWTDERIDLITDLWIEGKSASQIAAVLGGGFTRAMVTSKLDRLGLLGFGGRSTAQMRKPTIRRFSWETEASNG